MHSLHDRRTLVAGSLLAAAGAYIVFTPFRPSPGDCMLGGVIFRGLRGLEMCVQASAVPTVTGLAVGLGLVAIGLWYVVSDRLPARVATGLLAATLVAILAWSTIALVTSPTGPGKTFPPASETAQPVQTSRP